MKNFIQKLSRLTVVVLLFGSVLPTRAAFTSLYVFGDGISTTTNNPSAGQYYYGLRRSNGRVWAEVLAQRLGLGANSITNANWSNSSNNWSYYGQYSPNLVTNLNSFHTPSDAANALFIVWVNNADFVGDMGNIYPSLNIVTWTNAINQSLNNHWRVITNLYYAKGARTLIMPKAVDITETPQYDYYPAASKSFIRQRVIDFNVAFTTLINQARTSLPGITIYEPDFFALLDDVLVHASNYGLTNVLSSGQSIDVLEDSLANKSLNGPGANYIFWDAVDPSAKLHEVMADVAQQIISPVQIAQITALAGSNRLNLANVPVGLNGSVEGSTNLALANWTAITVTNGGTANIVTITSANTAQFVFVPTPPSWGVDTNNIVVSANSGSTGGGIAPGPGGTVVVTALQFYRLRFPYAWVWP
ncbi:MAG TPA: SGNH/GDSL hydrolase family protein [Methylomirabilota bacterium]|nr:SGNH/GDSL hydrolase family protein [Methylomirabilota bacterium]